MWLNVSRGSYLPIKIVNNMKVSKIEEKFDEHDMKKYSLNVFIVP